jgi:hypothetical protein
VADPKSTDTAKDTSGHKGFGLKGSGDEPGEVGEVIELVKTYVRQETVGPLKGIGRKIGLGVAGAMLIGLGLFFLAIGLLRLIQDHVDRLARGSLSWVAYAIVLVFAAIVTVIALMRVKKIEKELN